MSFTVNTLSVIFDLTLQKESLPAFRGAMAAFAGHDNALWHNHTGENEKPYLYRYPLIHYRIHNNNAALYGINEGAEAIDTVLRSKNISNFYMNGRGCPLKICEWKQDSNFGLKLLPQTHSYRLYNYLPLTPENYTNYKQLPKFTDKVQLIETLLANHIIAFAQAVGWQWQKDQRLEVVVQDIDRIKKTEVMGTPMMAFDLVFTANALLPDRLGIGRKTAFGYGWLYRLP